MANIFGTLILGVESFLPLSGGILVDVEVNIDCQTTSKAKLVELVCFGFQIGDIVYLGKEKHQIKRIKVDNFKIIYFLENGRSAFGENLSRTPPEFDADYYNEPINRLEALPPADAIEPIVYTCTGVSESIDLEKLRNNVLDRLNKLESMQ